MRDCGSNMGYLSRLRARRHLLCLVDVAQIGSVSALCPCYCLSLPLSGLSERLRPINRACTSGPAATLLCRWLSYCLGASNAVSNVTQCCLAEERAWRSARQYQLVCLIILEFVERCLF